ncbi:MAG: hypothetical protein RLZZ383_2490 [Pseudomonadota bacterium]|jgi:hypothetical protein
MPAGLFVAMLVAGLTLAATMLHLGGLTRDGRFASPDAAVEALRRQAPRVQCTAVHLSDDGRAALVEATDGRWLVAHLGVRPFARRLRPDDGVPSPTGVHYDLGFDAPAVDVRALRPHRAWLGQREAA